jgi:four helix bundle protein
MKLEELRVYHMAMDLGEATWKIVEGWDDFPKRTMGCQLVKAVDSVAANLSEGFGRYHYADSKRFCYYSRGSLFETKCWITKANNRKLIPDDEYTKFIQQIELLGIRINNYINSIGQKNVPENDGQVSDINELYISSGPYHSTPHIPDNLLVIK